MAATLAPDAVLHGALAPIFACTDTGKVCLVSGSRFLPVQTSGEFVWCLEAACSGFFLTLQALRKR